MKRICLALCLAACGSPPASTSTSTSTSPSTSTSTSPAPSTAPVLPPEPPPPPPPLAPAPPGTRDIHPISPDMPGCLEMYSACSPDPDHPSQVRCTSAPFEMVCGQIGRIPHGESLRCVCP